MVDKSIMSLIPTLPLGNPLDKVTFELNTSADVAANGASQSIIGFDDGVYQITTASYPNDTGPI